jgi:lysophospholipase-2
MSRLERDGNGKITIRPSFGSHSATLIILHGLGDTGEGFADVASSIASTFPYIKVILPTAKTQPVTLNGGMEMPSWYDIVGLSERAAEKCEGIYDSVAIVRQILEEENAEGLPYSRMALAGFSQGGALSLFTGLQLPIEQKLSGICVMSGYLAGASSFKLTEGLETIPILHCHGTADVVVRHEWAARTKEHLEAQVFDLFSPMLCKYLVI